MCTRKSCWSGYSGTSSMFAPDYSKEYQWLSPALKVKLSRERGLKPATQVPSYVSTFSPVLCSLLVTQLLCGTSWIPSRTVVRDGIKPTTAQEVPADSQLFSMPLTSYQMRSVEPYLYQLHQNWPSLSLLAIFCIDRTATTHQYLDFHLFF